MFEHADIRAFLPVAFLLVITPGATTAVVIRHALDGGHRAGATTAAGAAVGNATLAAAAAFGLAVLLQRLPAALPVLTLAGAGFLIWLGARALLRAAAPLSPRASAAAPATVSPRASFADGLVVTLLNPATITFYLVVVPVFLRGGRSTSGFATLAVIHVTMAFACHLVWAFAFDRLRGWLAYPMARRALDAGAGVALIWLGLRAAIA